MSNVTKNNIEKYSNKVTHNNNEQNENEYDYVLESRRLHNFYIAVFIMGFVTIVILAIFNYKHGQLGQINSEDSFDFKNCFLDM